MNRFFTLFKTEIKLTLRSLDMVIFAVLMPVVILAVVGLIFGNDAATPECAEGAVVAAAPGMINATFGAFLAIGVCAVGLMGLPLTLAEYRRRKVLKRLQVTPVHPGLLLSVQLATQALTAIVSAALVTFTARILFGLEVTGSLAAIVGAFLLVLLAIFALGLMIASTARDVRRAGMIASIVYFPMLLFSGTTIPFPVFPESVQRVALILPLRHGISLLNGAIQGQYVGAHRVEIGVLVACIVIGIAVSIGTFRWDMESGR